MFNRKTGLNILLDECSVPPTLWAIRRSGLSTSRLALRMLPSLRNVIYN